VALLRCDGGAKWSKIMICDRIPILDSGKVMIFLTSGAIQEKLFLLSIL
jgi:hypothetical protein